MRIEEKHVQASKISKILLPINRFIEAIGRCDSPKGRDRNKRDEYTDPGNGVFIFNIRGKWNLQDGIRESSEFYSSAHGPSYQS